MGVVWMWFACMHVFVRSVYVCVVSECDVGVN